MQLISSALIESFANEQSQKMESFLPELVKRLIVQSCPDRSQLRIPCQNDIWAPGFDGVLFSNTATQYVSKGLSIWEFGNSSDPLKKINEDYDKRTANSKGVNPKDAVFYLITPKIWAYHESITEWEASHNEHWKEVHVYDASVLCDWLNSEPVVCAWFLECFSERKANGFSTVNQAWIHFSKLTTPPLTHSLFSLGRDDAIQQLYKQLQRKICCVRSDTFYDAVGFCLSVFLKDKELANSIIVISNEGTYHTLSEIVRGKILFLLFPFSGQVSDFNFTILCQSREHTPRFGTIQISPLWKSQFEQALQDMGIQKPKSSELYTFTHGNLLSLIRHIPGNASDSTPKWASLPNISILCPLVFLRNYNTTNETAKRILTMLAGVDAASVQQKYEELLRMEDAPIKRVEEWLLITNYDEAWLTLQIDLSDTNSRKLFHTVLTLLKEYSEGAYPEFSDVGTFIGTLLFNYIYFAQTGSSETLINHQIQEILNFLQFSRCQTILLHSLPCLAEAAPSVVLGFLEQLMLPQRQTLYRQLSYSNKPHGVVLALQQLVKDQCSAITACELLYHLSKTQAFDYQNISARESLLNALCLWDSHTPIMLHEKVTFVEKIIQNDPAWGLSFAYDLLRKHSIVRGVRIGAIDHTYEEITEEELHKAKARIASVTLSTAIAKRELELTIQTLSHYTWFSEDTLLNAAQLFQPSDYSQEKLTPFVFQLHQCIYRIEKYYWNERTKWINPLRTWITRITENNLFLQVAWMFSSFFETPFQNMLELEATDYQVIKSHAQTARVDAFNELRECAGINTALQLIQCMDDCYAWGELLSKCLLDDELQLATTTIVNLGKHHILSGLVDSIPLACAEPLFSSLSEDLQSKVISSLSRTDIQAWLKAPELQRSYWQGKYLYSDDDWAYSNLLVYHPSGILPFIYQCQQTEPGINNMLLEVFQAIATVRDVNDITLLKLIIQKVDVCSYSDQWAEQCIQLVDTDILVFNCYDNYYPESLKKYFYQYPTSILDTYLKNQTLFLKLFSFYQLPKIAFDDYQAFRAWSDFIYETGQENPALLDILINAFARVSVGKDNFFPHDFVRMALEDYSNPALTQDVTSSYLDSRGGRSVLDGLPEKQMAEKTLQRARTLQLDYPQTANILRCIANNYFSESRQDHIYAETGRFG